MFKRAFKFGVLKLAWRIVAARERERERVLKNEMLREKSVEENKNGRKYQEDQWPMPIEQLRYYKKQTKG